MKVSIIIPVFGVEPYIEKCIESLLCQDIPTSDYELIFINDETKDHSWDIVKRMVAGHTNVRLLEQKNQGQGTARNNGLSHAAGDFVWFVDSDDWIEKNCIGTIIHELESDTDILSFAKFYPEGNWEGKNLYSIPNNINTSDELLRSNSPNPTQFYWFRTAFLREHNLTFLPGIKHEDSLFTPVAIASANKLQVYGTPVYHFLKRPNSTTTTLSPNRINDYQVVLDASYAFMLTIKDKNVRMAFRARLADIVMSYLDVARRNGPSYYEQVQKWIDARKSLISILKYSRKKNTVGFFVLQSILPIKTIKLYNIVAKIRYKK